MGALFSTGLTSSIKAGTRHYSISSHLILLLRRRVAAYACGFCPGHDMQQADARQTYTQSLVGGTPTWVILPREAWP
eukprot:6649993-Pyramimonas_sp.AAC.1